MDLTLNAEQKEFQELASQFAVKELAPRAHQCDLQGELPEAVLNKAWQTGLVHPHLPVEQGGMGLSLWDTALIAESLSYGCSGIASAFEFSCLATLALIHAGHDQQKTAFLKPLSEQYALWGLPLNLFATNYLSPLTAQSQGDSFALNGVIPAMGNASLARCFLVSANLNNQAALYLVPGDGSGLQVEEKLPLLGRRAADIRRVSFKNVSVPKENLIGTVPGAAAILEAVRPLAFCLLSAATVGIAQNALDNALRYSKERHAFGKPIAQHQAISFILADMDKDITAARLLTWQTAVLLDKHYSGSPAGKSDGQSITFGFASAAQARVFSQEMAMRVTTDAVQVFGGYGYSKEYPVEKLMRDSKVYQLYDGTAVDLKTAVGKELVQAGR